MIVHPDSTNRSSALRRRQPTKGDGREQALLDCAEELLKEGRFEEASVAALAQAAGISRPTFYFYFSSKQMLLAGLIDRTMKQLAAELQDQRVDPNRDAAQVIRQMLRATAQMWWRHRVVLAAVSEMAGSNEDLFDRIRAVNEAGVDDVAEVLVDAGTTPEVSTSSRARETALLLAWMSERNFYVLARSRPSRQSLLALADRLATVWLRAAGIAEP